jgi:hypothetical protein
VGFFEWRRERLEVVPDKIAEEVVAQNQAAA